MVAARAVAAVRGAPRAPRDAKARAHNRRLAAGARCTTAPPNSTTLAGVIHLLQGESARCTFSVDEKLKAFHCV